jgi:hypothetical protein
VAHIADDFAAAFPYFVACLFFKILAERIVRRDEEPGLAARLENATRERVTVRPGIVGPMNEIGRALAPVSSAVPAPEPIATLFFSRTMSPTASATAEFGRSTIMSTPSTSSQRRAMPAPTSGLFWWSAETTSTFRFDCLAKSSIAICAAMTEPGPWKSA